MARPKKQGKQHFRHSTDSIASEKIDIMRTKHGNDGYAFYFILLERIYQTPDLELDISDALFRMVLARKVEVPIQKFEEMLQTSLEVELFDEQAYQTRGVLTSRGIKSRSATKRSDLEPREKAVAVPPVV